MRGTLLLAVCCATLPLALQGAEVYRWIDAQGVVHYSDVPSSDAEKINPGKFLDQSSPDDALPYETRIAQQNFPVVLYVSAGCGGACDRARSLLDQRGIPYTEKTLSTKDDIDSFRKLSGDEIVPTLGLGRSYLKGFQEEHWHGELDIAGYPKIAPYRAPTVDAPAEKPAPNRPDAR